MRPHHICSLSLVQCQFGHSYHASQVSAFPGETIVLEMSVRDTFNNPTEGFFRAYSLDEVRCFCK